MKNLVKVNGRFFFADNNSVCFSGENIGQKKMGEIDQLLL